ncbi:MAG TPA: hypothetical protein VD969_15885 [Symbiobacteriaceae bacterium]|nr:hypothetical protein [Symbiobacteriaceae bacterium]
MRSRILPAIPAALLLILGAAAPALAGGGLPVLSSMKAGNTEVTIYGDSMFVHTGTNTLTVEATGLPEGAAIALNLIGPDGKTVVVPLRPLRVVAGPADAHGGDHENESDGHESEDSGHESEDSGHESDGDAHETESTQHGSSHDAQADQHGDEPAESESPVWFRGKASVPTTGTWKAQLEIGGAKATDELKVVGNGPSPLYLAFTGVIMGGTITYGAIQRRRQSQTGRA